MTSHATLRALLAPITTREAGRITTHYETCYQWHVGCLAALVSDLLPADAEPTPATITAEQREAMGRALARRMSSAPDADAPGWLTHVDAMLDASGIEVSR